ncbi:hypothetical protein BuS5_01964 [Desulfosarcina sp. BuS5]|uniref:hypothetical protein n=1 Tax=Desulfosarcina sp. BuS5 TaxID=933262 RepID=UPI000489E520|nr:hypothetical protein [Desulfosarcina sp. BuS5]WDN88996.1 hypothetical protein BuS5_01964 [Desulfosarcina sp. BuS5]
MKNKIFKERLKFFLLGMLVVLGILFLTGADNQPALNNGRYQISAWGGTFGEKAGGMGAFVVDTVSGEAKNVYTRVYGISNNSVVVKNNLNKHFNSY